MSDPKRMTPERLAELEELKAKSTPVTAWYAHHDGPTVRGPYCRWFRVEGPSLEKYEKYVATKTDDVEYAAAAMTELPNLIAEIRAAWSEIAELKALNEALKADHRDDVILAGGQQIEILSQQREISSVHHQNAVLKRELEDARAERKAALAKLRGEPGDICPACGSDWEPGTFKRCRAQIIEDRDKLQAERDVAIVERDMGMKHLALTIEALKKCELLMSGASSVSPMTDSMVLELVRECLEDVSIAGAGEEG